MRIKNYYKALIKTSIHPEITNELLKEEVDCWKYSQKVISEDFLADNIITADSEIDLHSGGSLNKKILKNQLKWFLLKTYWQQN